MRDPNRIADVLNEIGKYWMKYPDLRLGQLVSNMNSMHRNRSGMNSNNDVHPLEDDDLLAILKQENES